MADQYKSIVLVVEPHQSTNLTVTVRAFVDTVTVLPRQSGPMALLSLPQAAATIEPGG